MKYPNRQDMLQIFVYTDMKNLKREKENSDGLIHVFVDPRSNSNQASPDQNERKVFYDAAFWREGPGGSVGHTNEWYRYAVDLARPDARKSVVIRGKQPNAKEILLDSWETTWDGPRIRVRAYNLEDVDPPGTYYTFECLNENSLLGGPIIMTLRTDKRVAIPREQIRLISSEIAYVFMGWLYAVTTDGGYTWSVWDAQDNLKNWQCCDYDSISDVQLSKEGTGTMVLKHHGIGKSLQELHTTNFGREWR